MGCDLLGNGSFEKNFFMIFEYCFFFFFFYHSLTTFLNFSRHCLPVLNASLSSALNLDVNQYKGMEHPS